MLSQIVTQTKEYLAIPPQSINAATVNGTEIDTLGYDTITAYVLVGATDGLVDFKFQETATSGSGEADVTDGAFTQFGASDDNKLASGSIAIQTHLRYIRLVCTVASGDTALCGAVVLLSNANETVATADHGTSPAGLTVNI
jgi:hypothetical protein